MNRPHVGQHVEQNRVTGLVVSRDLLILLGDHLAALLRADAHLHKGPVDIGLADKPASLPGGQDGRLVHQVLQVRARESGGGLRNPAQVHILAQGLILGVHL